MSIKVNTRTNKVEATAFPAVISTVAAGNVDYKVYGAAEGAGFETENLWDGDVTVAWLQTSSGNIVKYRTAGDNSTSICIPCLPLTTYSIKKFSDTNRLIIGAFSSKPTNDGAKGRLLFDLSSSTKATITTLSDSAYIVFYIHNILSYDEKATVVKSDTAPVSYIPPGYQIPLTVESGEESTTTPIYIGDSKLMAEEYVDYESGKVWKQFEISGLSEPLCGIGEYKDTLDLSTGTVSRYIKKLVLTGTENWVGAGTNLYFRISIGALNTVLNSYDLFCTHFVTASISSASTAIGASVYNSGASNAATLNIRPSGITTATAFKKFLADEYANGTPVTVWYVLVTPTTETVTVPTGLTGIVEGYMTQSGVPTQASSIYPTANGEKQPNDTYSVFTLQPTDPPVALPELSIYQGDNTLSFETTVQPEKLELTSASSSLLKEETITKILRTEDDGQGTVNEHILYDATN